MQKYLHQRRDWPNFDFDQNLILPLFARISRRQGHLLGRMETLGIDARNRAQVTAITEYVIQTGAFEGENRSHNQVRTSVVRQLSLDVAGLSTSDWKSDGIVQLVMDATPNIHAHLTENRF